MGRPKNKKPFESSVIRFSVKASNILKKLTKKYNYRSPSQFVEMELKNYGKEKKSKEE